ncbi:hypothetical protein AT246_06995 [Bartonella henselae]|nr:hypothetical protein AT247_03530 [Bartonella henselae]OLL57969.1 hypothetical protein AT246_06995 [Bartonella henselae]
MQENDFLMILNQKGKNDKNSLSLGSYSICKRMNYLYTFIEKLSLFKEGAMCEILINTLHLWLNTYSLTSTEFSEST